MNISENGLDLIKNFEGFCSHPYKDVGGRWTIGYGHLIQLREDFAGGITKETATALLDKDLDTTQDFINHLVIVALTQGQFDALCSLVYNWGVGHFEHSALLKSLNNADYTEALSDLENIDTVNGVVCSGLVRRRQLEAQVWNGGVIA